MLFMEQTAGDGERALAFDNPSQYNLLMNISQGMAALLFLTALQLCRAQDIPVSYELGENYSDRYKYSTLLTSDRTSADETVFVRTYYSGYPLRPKGHFIEIYDAEMNLARDYNYKYAGNHMIDGFVKNGQLYLLELTYSTNQEAYQYVVHQSPLHEFRFTERLLLSVPSKEVANPLAVSKYNRSFGNGFSTAVHFDKGRSAFAITVQHRERRNDKYHVYLFGTDLKQQFAYDFTTEIADKNYAFESIEVSKDLKTLYLTGKVFFKKRRFEANERRFRYELVKIDNGGHRTQQFDDSGRFPESLKPVLSDRELKIVGFYADRKSKRYNGLAYFRMDTNSLDITDRKYNPFSDRFMMDKFGREVDTELKNLVFKDVHITADNGILFSAEEYYMTQGRDISGGGTQITDRYHYNDIVIAKLNASGAMEWARNINKAEVTQGDASYASYAAYGVADQMYFFINSGENPQTMSKERILFKQGYSRNPNMFVIKVDGEGNLSHKKLIDDKEIRLPIMVSRPLIDTSSDNLLFYAKRGKRKQLVRVLVN
ncbi:hypothetical protein RQM65_08490 [Pricia sp. S334]|uniref:DKNYY family protein n=1 Tax=Pricia mediterranea TaxID=3076079 RepID=A0ABU3L660_9FLAO|nr:hypothetical protein [Pricia sp. S334]MDT7828699.1 hypothetical protein [Pricia sp. S334]